MLLHTFVRLLGVSGREVPSPDCLSPGANLIPASSIDSARMPMRIREQIKVEASHASDFLNMYRSLCRLSIAIYF